MTYITVAIPLLIIILILIGILVVPFQISLQLNRNDSINKGHFRLIWLNIKLINRNLSPKKDNEKSENLNVNNIPKIAKLSLESLPYIFNIFKAFLKSIYVRKAWINIIIGFPSPADTAIIGGYLLGLSSMINSIPNTSITVEPDFRQERIDGEVSVEMEIKLLWVVIESMKALTKKSVRSLFSELRKLRV